MWMFLKPISAPYLGIVNPVINVSKCLPVISAENLKKLESRISHNLHVYKDIYMVISTNTFFYYTSTFDRGQTS